MNFERWDKQLHFIIEIDKLKNIYHRIPLICESNRFENNAEHSWHVALMALVFLEYTTRKESIDLFRVIKILLVHDLIKIYKKNDLNQKDTQEKEDINYLFSMLPEDQHLEMFRLWNEFNSQKTLEAKYAVAIDRMQPLLLAYFSQGCTNVDRQVDLEKILKRNEILQEIAPALWDYAKEIVYKNE